MQVFATDLWISATENFNRFRELGLDGRIVPIHADAHDLPYAEEYFDGIVPEELAPFWVEDMNFYSREWWRELWLKAKSVDLKYCWSLQCHLEAWEDWLKCDNPYAIRDIDMMKAEGGRYFDTIGLIAEVK